MQHFSFNLDMKPSTLSLESKLGNLVARDRSFGHEYLFSTICDLRPEGDIDSLIELQYSTYKVRHFGMRSVFCGLVDLVLFFLKVRLRNNVVCGREIRCQTQVAACRLAQTSPG
jgi:hypothetical protein